MKSYRGFALLLLLGICLHLYSQPSCSFEHYSNSEGLEQSIILTIIQDKKGYIWLGTYDGLVRFDGYEFKNFKVLSANADIAKSNRIDQIREDIYGRLWLCSNEDTYCFISGVQQFKKISFSDINSDSLFPQPQIHIKKSGKVWLTSERYGCICITDSLFHTVKFSKENGKLLNNHINSVIEDNELNTWLLTNNGLVRISGDSLNSIQYLFENLTDDKSLNQAFFSVTEFKNEIWFESTYGLIWRYSKKSKTFREFKLNIQSNIKNFYAINDDYLLIVTSKDGFFTYKFSTGELKKINISNIKDLNSEPLTYVYFNEPNQIWFANSDEGIYKFDLETETLKHFKVPVDDNTVNRFYHSPFVKKDNNNNLWVHPKGGGFSFYNKEKDELEPFYNAPDDPNRKFSNIMHSAYIDRQGILWFCSKSFGLEKVVFSKNQFRTQLVERLNLSSLTNNVRVIFQEKSGKIWVATKEGGLYLCDEKFQQIKSLSPLGSFSPNSLWSSPIYCIIQDTNNAIWLGTKGGGIYKLEPRKNNTSYTISHFIHAPSNPYSLSNNNVYSIFQDNLQRIWIGTLGGGINLLEMSSEKSPIFINSNNRLKNFPSKSGARVRCIAQCPNGNLYAGTSGGIISWKSDFKLPEEIIFNSYKSEVTNKNSLSNNEIRGIVPVSDTEIYIATFGGGLNKVSSFTPDGFPKSFISYSKDEGLQSNLIMAIQKSKQNKLWISTENDLIRFDPTSASFETFHEVNNLMAGGVFTEASAGKLNDGELVFGNSNGMIVFNPKNISIASFAPNIVLSNFQVFNKPLNNKQGVPLNGSIDDINKIDLSFKQNFFKIEFSALDYSNSQNILYAYKLEGFDKEWNFANKQRIANYTNIPKGKYIFKVKSTNSNGIWANNERNLRIIIHPSFWETPLAYGLYALLSALLFFIIKKHILTIYKLKRDVKIQKKISDLKLKFFTDISHEIRTPLTLITGPVENMIHDVETPDEIKKQLSFVSQNANRLLKLVNQILDFRKFQNQKLKIEETNLGQFTEKISSDFMEIAEEKGINFSFNDTSGKAIIWVDQDSLEKIIMNLLSNAIKYNKAGNTIKVLVEKESQYSTLKVMDNGQGISEKKQKDLFVRFTSYNQDSSNPSTGIGLSIVKEIADRHSAQVSVESEIGKGSVFTIRFLNGYNHFIENVEIISPAEESQEALKVNITIADKEKTSSAIENSKHSILVVEDDNDLRSFIKSILEKNYIIYEAENGEDGFNKAVSLCPDFIVSDIMMPKMDGMELLKCLRNEIETSHIPILLLTAKTNFETQLQGLSYGADDYITKPFSITYFKAKIENLIQQRKRLHSIYSSEFNFKSSEPNLKPNLITSEDEKLMEKIISNIHSNIDNGDFSVDELGKIIGLSRSTFFNKLKSLTGMSPVEFIRDVRIKHAAQLIKSKQLLIKEICYLCGFSDIKYFGKCFKNKYGMTPIQYRNTNISTKIADK